MVMMTDTASPSAFTCQCGASQSGEASWRRVLSEYWVRTNEHVDNILSHAEILDLTSDDELLATIWLLLATTGTHQVPPRWLYVITQGA